MKRFNLQRSIKVSLLYLFSMNIAFPREFYLYVKKYSRFAYSTSEIKYLNFINNEILNNIEV